MPDPYRVWLSEIMLQQTTVSTVAPRYQAFLDAWPRVQDMAAAPVADILGQWAGLGYYARARNLHKCAQVVSNDFGGIFPKSEAELVLLPGIGDYTAAAIAAIAFDRRAIVVDGNIERVVARLFEIETPLPRAKPVIKKMADTIWPRARSGDFAQALMDLGATICRPKAPTCLLCPLQKKCGAHLYDSPERFPQKAPKRPKPTRFGVVYALENTRGEILFERRPDKGLLGGMLGLPGTEWSEEKPKPSSGAPLDANWQHVGEITHTFTHFHLVLGVYLGGAPKGFRRKPAQAWIAPEAARLPTVMAKALRVAQGK